MVELLVGIFTLVVLTVVINKTTEDRFHAIKPHLREVWWALGFVYISYRVFRPESEQYFMTLKRGFGAQHPASSYLLAAFAGAMLFTSYWWFLGKVLPVKADANDQRQAEPKKPEVQQSSQGAGSPNTVIIGNNNTVTNSTDPKVLAKLDEIKKLVQAQQGDRATPDKLLQKYPLGYVVFDIDQKSSVFPYATDSLQWEFDWSTVKLVEDKQEKILRLTIPNVTHKGASHPMIRNVQIGGQKKLGQFDGIIFRDGTMRMMAEILAMRPNGIVFLIGFDHAPKN